MASSLPQDLVQEILVRLPPDEPEHLARASLVCKAWRRVLSDRRCFWRRCREFHGVPPPLLGYIQNPAYDGSPMRFVHTATTSIASAVISMPTEVDCSGWRALDCRQGRVLILDAKKDPSKQLIVWDPITGSQQHLSVPPASHRRFYQSLCYAGAVLCAEDGCDHLDCHGGPFHVVLVEANRAGPRFAIATKYSSVTGGAWGAPTSNDFNHRSIYRFFSANGKPNLLIGDDLYFPYEHGGKSIVIEYDLSAHRLSEIDLPQHLYGAILMKAEDGGPGLVTLKDNSIYLWSRQDVPNVLSYWWVQHTRWVEHRVVKLGTLLPRQVPFESYKVIGFAEGTNTIFINISTGIFMLDLKTEKMRKVGEREADRVDPILPYMSFYVPRLPNLELVKLEGGLVVEKRADAFVGTYLLLFLMLGWVTTLCNAG